MVETYQHFGRRIKDLNTKNAKMANGYYTTVRADGLVIARPRRRSAAFPVKASLVLIALFFCFKAFVLSAIGPGAYDIRLNSLEEGTMIEQVGAWALSIDPVTQVISAKIGPIFRG